MQIGSATSASSGVNNAVGVKVLNSQRDQLKAVVGTLLQGAAQTADAVRASGKGQLLNVVA